MVTKSTVPHPSPPRAHIKRGKASYDYLLLGRGCVVGRGGVGTGGVFGFGGVGTGGVLGFGGVGTGGVLGGGVGTGGVLGLGGVGTGGVLGGGVGTGGLSVTMVPPPSKKKKCKIYIINKCKIYVLVIGISRHVVKLHLHTAHSDFVSW